jgi:NAD-dependent dihydropyrimidine dehydrogenase PreA subunit
LALDGPARLGHDALVRASPRAARTVSAARPPGDQEGSHVPHIIAEPCIGVKDQACVDVCPVECIYEADDQFYIHPEECIDCGACIPACPVDAIFVEEDVPAEWASFIKKNYELSGL